MGIQLDWQIESERQQRQATEDPGIVRQRKVQRRRLLIAVLVVVLLLGGTVFTIIQRLNNYDARIEQDLLYTVDAEVRALRIGDEDGFTSIRRSESYSWNGAQQETFIEYQQLKQSGQLELTGQVLDFQIDLDASRARVLVEEIFNGEQHAVLWFYWYYSDEDGQDGWRRVPPDTEFWGESDSQTLNNVTITYHELDESLANALIQTISDWWQRGCVLLNCGVTFPELTVNIVPGQNYLAPVWDEDAPLTLEIVSPLADDRAPVQNPLSPVLSQQISQQLADKMVELTVSTRANLNTPLDITVTDRYADATWLADAVAQWLVDRLLNIQRDTFLNSLESAYGPDAVSRLIANIAIERPLGDTIAIATGLSSAEVPLQLQVWQWNDYFSWRLAFETQLLRGDFRVADVDNIGHNLLYSSGANAQSAAENTRLTGFQASLPDNPMVTQVTILADTGIPTADTVANYTPDELSQQISFVWDNQRGTWKRLN